MSSEFGFKPAYYPISNSSKTIVAKTNATQSTSITTAVDVDGYAGMITTQSASAAGAATQTFQVNNANVAATSIVHAYVVGYAGTLTTNGIPVVSVTGIAAGQFNINISNAHASNALSGALTIAYEVK